MSDATIVHKVQAGDTEAFNELVLKYQERIHKLIYKYVKDTSQVDDLVQDTFMKAYTALDSFKGDSAFYTWLYRIAVNTAQNYLTSSSNSNKKLEVYIDDPDLFTDLSIRTHDNDTPEALLITRETRDSIDRALANLPTELREVFLLREEQNLNYQEIGDKLGWAQGTVRSRLHRARQIILDKINKEK